MSDTKDIALSIKNVSKAFKLPHERHSGLKSSLVSIVGGKHKRGYERQKVLDDVSFEVEKGEFFGVVGRNGSGKSTLLKIMSNIYMPDSGKVVVNGSLTPFIELGVGFNPELTGLENIYLNGALLGFSRKEMQEKLADIIEFSELQDFMDQKLKNYSSGMQVRLAFSIAIQSNADILILDEVLAVGDEAFQRKCNDFFMRIKEDPSKTVILVTHAMHNVKKYCDRAMMLQDGEVVAIGSPEIVADEYSLANQAGAEKIESQPGAVLSEGGAKITVKPRVSNEEITFAIQITPKADIQDALLAFAIMRGKNDWVYWWANDKRGTDMRIDLKKGIKKSVEVTLQNVFPEGSYRLDYILGSKKGSEVYAQYNLETSYEIKLKKSKDKPIKNVNYWRPDVVSVVEK